MPFEKTNRGFKVYGKIAHDAYGSEIRLVESSGVGRPCVHIFSEHPDYERKLSPHLTVENALELIDLLKAFVADANDPENWRNSKEYRETWG